MPPTPESIQALIKQHNIEAYEHLILPNLIPAIRLDTRPIKRVAVGASKLGGKPDLPSRDRWPTNKGRPLHFLGHINLADLPKDWPTPLPTEGHLWFWFDTLGENLWGEPDTSDFLTDGPSAPGMHQVTYEPDPEIPLKRERFPTTTLKFEYGQSWEPFPQLALSLKPIYNITFEGLEALSEASFKARTRKEGDRVFKFEMELHHPAKDGNHRLLGSDIELQCDLRLDCEAITRGIESVLPLAHPDYPKLQALKKKKADWILLAKLDSDTRLDWCWGDAGQLFYLIRKKDLVKRRFDKVHGIWVQS